MNNNINHTIQEVTFNWNIKFFSVVKFFTAVVIGAMTGVGVVVLGGKLLSKLEVMKELSQWLN